MSMQFDFTTALTQQLSDNGYTGSNVSLIVACALAQACNESANFTSNPCLNYNNCMGYGCVPGDPYQVSCNPVKDDVKYLAGYASIADCARDFGDYLCRYDRSVQIGYINSLSDYCVFLQSNGYFTESFQSYYSNLLQYYTDPSTQGSIPDSTLVSSALGYVSQFTGSAVYSLITCIVTLAAFISILFYLFKKK